MENSVSRMAAVNYIKHYGIKSVVEFGCGLGKTTDFIKRLSGVYIIGVDISATAIQKAKQSYGEIEFHVDSVSNIKNYINTDCVYLSEITWYLLEGGLFDNMLNDILVYFKGKYVINNLVFYKGQQQYGVEYFTNINSFIKYCPFKLLGKVEVDFSEADTIETSTIFRVP